MGDIVGIVEIKLRRSQPMARAAAIVGALAQSCPASQRLDQRGIAILSIGSSPLSDKMFITVLGSKAGMVKQA